MLEFTNSYLLELLIIGLTSGCLYALVALGFTLIYGIVGVINFSHGDVCAFGAYAGFVAITTFSLPFGVALAFAAISSGLLILMIERFLFSGLPTEKKLTILVAHIGTSILIRGCLSLAFGENFKSIKTIDEPTHGTYIFNVWVSQGQLEIVSATLILSVVLWFLIYRTDYGRALRAISQDREAAQAIGIPVNVIVAFTYALGGFCGGAAGLMAGQVAELTPQMGIFLGIKAFTASVIGGIGRIYGAIFGGLFVGISEAMVTGLIGNEYRELFVFTLLAIALLLLPRSFLLRSISNRW